MCCNLLDLSCVACSCRNLQFSSNQRRQYLTCSSSVCIYRVTQCHRHKCFSMFFPISTHCLSTQQHCRGVDLMACQITQASHVARIFLSNGLAFLARLPANQSFLPGIETLGCVSSDHVAEAGKNCMLLAFLPAYFLPCSSIGSWWKQLISRAKGAKE